MGGTAADMVCRTSCGEENVNWDRRGNLELDCYL